MLLIFSATASEVELKRTLMNNYIKTVRPVKNYSTPVQVKFDIALRAVVDLVSFPKAYYLFVILFGYILK